MAHMMKKDNGIQVLKVYCVTSNVGVTLRKVRCNF